MTFHRFKSAFLWFAFRLLYGRSFIRTFGQHSLYGIQSLCGSLRQTLMCSKTNLSSAELPKYIKIDNQNYFMFSRDIILSNIYDTSTKCVLHNADLYESCQLTIICSDIGYSPGRREAIIWTNARILLIEPFGTKLKKKKNILIQENALIMLSTTCWPFFLSRTRFLKTLIYSVPTLWLTSRHSILHVTSTV